MGTREEKSRFQQDIEVVSKALRWHSTPEDIQGEGERLWQKFDTTKQEPVRLAVALRGFFMEDGISLERKEEYGQYLQKRIRSAVETLIDEEEVEKIAHLESLGWFGQTQLEEFIRIATNRCKTAIMEQIAQEYQVGLVAYTITHHTRQSAIGLPHIEKKVYNGKQIDVTEYTMSEIIASVYESIEQTGKQEGILFIDEINCVSETLAPTMLQFIQNKTFGSHKVPERGG